jgi:sialic acid synthase SpsE
MTIPPVLIAEIGCNHRGDIDVAREFVDIAATFCNVKHVKFQKRSTRELLTNEQYSMPHPVPENSYGKTYGEHRDYLEFTKEQHRDLKKYCEERDVVYSTSIWDIPSFIDVLDLEPMYLKIPSALNTNYELLDLVCRKFPRDLHLSLGMTTRKEEEEIVSFLGKRDRLNDLVLYACTSGYPIMDSDACLLEIKRLRNSYGDDIKAVGFSGHHKGIAIDVAAYVLGAHYIERHFTLDRSWKGTDHAASLEPDGLRRLRRNLDFTAEALDVKWTEILPIEVPQREKLKIFRAQKNT